MDTLFTPLANTLGASVGQIKLIFCLLVAYPLGSVFIRVPSSKPTLRHVLNISIAILFFAILRLYGAFLQLLASIVGTYLIAKYDRSARMPWIVFVFVMGHLTINHVIRAVYEFSYETIEVTGPQMVLAMKLTTFAWNVWDSRRPTEDLDKWQLAKRVTEYPSLLGFLGYAFYFPGLLVGPYLDYQEYNDLINETTFRKLEMRDKAKAGRLIPKGRKRVAYMKMLMGLIYLGIFVVLGGTHNFGVTLTPWFASKSLLFRIAAFQAYGILERTKYYAIWTLTEGASILTGLGFTGFGPKGESTWEGAANVKVMQIEFAPNFKVLLDSWNMKTNIWLRECVYKRVTPKGKKPGNLSSMITFFTSAFWHGIAPGYYLTFSYGGFITAAARLARANIRPLILPGPNEQPSTAKRLYDLGGIILSIVIVNYATAPFMLLSVKDSLTCWSRLGWYGHIIIFGALLFFYGGGTVYFKQLQKEKGIAPPGKGANGTATKPPAKK
ncbi:MBOAT, membrane-bound O-acyltransferase family-domain-containing protein [Amanita rubescens]|nr:MBOAT, membrane-bound O-acyltransferase family-domain-containing protein [Amanita rubescens]